MMKYTIAGWFSIIWLNLGLLFSKKYRFRTGAVVCVTGLALIQVSLTFRKDGLKGRNKKQFRNYFMDLATLKHRNLLINSTNCKIPHFEPFERSMYSLFQIARPSVVCNVANYNWSSIHNNELVLYPDNMQKNGYSFDPGFCCYKTISRIEQSETKYDSDADSTVSISEECLPLENVRTVITVEFVVVECASILGKVARLNATYRAFHASAITGTPGKHQVKKKISHWKKQDEESREEKEMLMRRRPPNVLVVGLDSTSRLNFRRYMTNTLALLERIGAVEMFGFTKGRYEFCSVGQNTFPNFIPLMTGYSEEDLKDICYAKRYVKQDNCPFVWKRFESANYITGHVEDNPKLAIFNYAKTGFVKQPVDFYGRPFFAAASKYDEECIGPLSNDEAIFSYLESILDLGHINKTPVFATSWSTSISHESYTGIQLLDEPYRDFLLRLEEKGYLENTIMFFMGDHGYRYGKIRETLMGYYEDRLPNLWIYLGPKVKERFPMWEQMIRINSRRLSTPFNLYWTFNEILKMSNIPDPEEAFKIGTNEVVSRKHRYSFTEEIPEAVSCKDTGVPVEFCVCNPLYEVNSNDSIVVQTAELAVEKINTKILFFSPCAKLNVSRIISGAARKNEDLKRFVVSFVGTPGDFLIESQIDYNERTKSFEGEVTLNRADGINRDHIRCIQDSEQEQFCFCSVK